MDGAVPSALAVPEIVAFVDDDQPVAAQVGELADHPAEGQYPGPQLILIHVVFPHGDEVLGADDERFQPVVILEDASDGGSHECLAKSHDIPDKHAVALVQVMGRYLDGCCLEVEQPVAEHLGNPELGETRARLVREVIGHLEVDVVGRYQCFTCPTVLDGLKQFVCDVSAEVVGPPVLEPLLELESGVVVEHVHVQLALPGESREGQVATAQVADDWVDGIVSEQQVELRVQRVTQEELDDDLLGAELVGQLPKGPLVGVGRYADGELLAELLG